MTLKSLDPRLRGDDGWEVSRGLEALLGRLIAIAG